MHHEEEDVIVDNVVEDERTRGFQVIANGVVALLQGIVSFLLGQCLHAPGKFVSFPFYIRAIGFHEGSRQLCLVLLHAILKILVLFWGHLLGRVLWYTLHLFQ